MVRIAANAGNAMGIEPQLSLSLVLHLMEKAITQQRLPHPLCGQTPAGIALVGDRWPHDTLVKSDARLTTNGSALPQTGGVLSDADDDQARAQLPTEELLIELPPPVVDAGVDGAGIRKRSRELIQLNGFSLGEIPAS